jgi:hypothetical protein
VRYGLYQEINGITHVLSYKSKEYSNGKSYLLDVINVIAAGFMPEQRARRIC